MDDLKKRKNTRLKNANYNGPGAFFLTICTKDKRCILSRIVGTGVLDGPQNKTGVLDGPRLELTEYGRVAEKYLLQMSHFYENLTVEKYVIMPNHIHVLIFVSAISAIEMPENGPSRTPVPTVQNSTVSRFVSTFKRFCNKEYGENIWQARSYDHIIRDQKDYEEHVNYIYYNPIRWYKEGLFLGGDEG